MAYTTTKTDWLTTDYLAHTDLNRIESNIKALKEEAMTIAGNKTFSGDNTHLGNDTVSGTKTLTANVEGDIVYSSLTKSGTKAISADVTYSGTLDYSASTVTLPSEIYGIAPIGSIIIWGGTAATVPIGWNLCDGTNGTKDLRDLSVLNYGTNEGVFYDVDDTDAAPSHAHCAATQEFKLTDKEIASHNHTVAGKAHTHSIIGRSLMATGLDHIKFGIKKSYGSSPASITTKTSYAVITENLIGGDGATENVSTGHTHAIPAGTASASTIAIAYIQRIS